MLDQWLLLMVLINTYFVSYYSDIEGKRSAEFRSQRDFRLQIIEGLIAMSENAPGIRRPHNSRTKPSPLTPSNTGHHLVKRGSRWDCAACKGHTFWDKPRAVLAPKTANQKTSTTRRSTRFCCKECNMALCGKGVVFVRYHRIKDN